MFFGIIDKLKQRSAKRQADYAKFIADRGIAKQILIVRKDLNMRKGKIAAQCAHASLGAILKNSTTEYIHSELSCHSLMKRIITYDSESSMASWLNHSFTKICVYVNSEEELLQIQSQAISAGILNCLITDSGKTEFNNIPTNTVLALGPAWSTDIDPITKHLPLL
jgi:PTH2 family peptidyl-tRNA hydrolase